MFEPLSHADCEAMDLADPLAPLRARFTLPEQVIYLDGNSLGALPAATPAALARAVSQEWGEGLIGSWNAAGWIDAPARLGAKIAPLIGAAPDEVIVSDTTSANVFKLAAAALRLRPDRRAILCDAEDFPTDLYMLQGLADLLGGVAVRALPEAQWALDDTVALVVSSHVNYRTGAVRDMAGWTARAHAAGALTLWDLSHSVGALAVDLKGADADFAVGCGYKYLNGGPGAPAFLYVAERLQREAASPLSGWMGHAQPFAFDADYRPAPGMARWLCGTPSILALAALEAGVATFEGVDMAHAAAKSRSLSELFLNRVAVEAPGLFTPVSTGAAPRGSHVSLRHPQGYAIVQALIAEGVVGDFRAPDILRFGFTPLYLRHVDVWCAAEKLGAIMRDSLWRAPQFAVRSAVT